MRLVGDEASHALASANFGAWVVGKAMLLATRLPQFLKAMGVVIPVLVWSVQFPARLIFLPFLGLAALSALVGFALSYATALALLPLLLLVGLLYRAYSPWLTLYAHLIEPAAESAPAGAWQLVILPARAETVFGGSWASGQSYELNPPHSRFAHADIYEHPQAIRLIADWISATQEMAREGISRKKYVWDDSAPHTWPVEYFD